MDELLVELVEPMLKRRMFVALSEPVGPAEAELPLLPEHLRHLISLEQQGVLFAGALFLGNGQPGQRALCIIRAASEDEARTIIAREPFRARGMRTFTLHEWSLNQGRITLQIDCSSPKAAVDAGAAR